MSGRDHYYNKAKQEGYRSRAAYKLKQLDTEASLFSPGSTVLDLGAAPGGWLQVANERVGKSGRVIGVDRQQIDPIENVETIRGDITQETTLTAIRETADQIDVVLSDMAPNMTGEYSVDHARSIHLGRQALSLAQDLLAGGGDLVVKVFDGPDLEGFRADLDQEFDYVQLLRPPASRDASSEVYLVGKGRLTAPVREGEELDVDIVSTGEEGDGVARVDDFTVFVPDTTPGDTVSIRIETVKPRFAFATRLDDPES